MKRWLSKMWCKLPYAWRYVETSRGKTFTIHYVLIGQTSYDVWAVKGDLWILLND